MGYDLLYIGQCWHGKAIELGLITVILLILQIIDKSNHLFDEAGQLVTAPTLSPFTC